MEATVRYGWYAEVRCFSRRCRILKLISIQFVLESPDGTSKHKIKTIQVEGDHYPRDGVIKICKMERSLIGMALDEGRRSDWVCSLYGLARHCLNSH